MIDLDAIFGMEEKQETLAETLTLLTPEADRSMVVCPWCRSVDIESMVDEADGLRCGECKRIAWVDTPEGGIVRADCVTNKKRGNQRQRLTR